MPIVDIPLETYVKIKEQQLELAKQGKIRRIAEITSDAILKGLPDVRQTR